MFELPSVFKEITPECSYNNKWKEIIFTNGGIPSTLQDIKVVPHSFGYAFKEFPNRFIYWKTNYDVLEIVEQSLDFNLSNNQIRYKFQNTPILDGITIYERADTIVLLVPTVSSVHRLTFPRPIYERLCDFRSTSIFTEVSCDSVLDPTTYHLFNTMPYLPHSAASLLADDDDNAVFGLALNNNSILLIKLQRLTGMATTHYLNTEASSRKRFLSGLTEVLLRSKSSDDSTVSLALEKHHKEVYLFALSSNGHLRVWCLTKMTCIYEFDFTTTNQTLTGAQYHVLRKKLCGSQLTLAVYSSSLEHSRMLVLRPFLKKDEICLDTEPLTYATPANMDLIEMNVDCEGSVILCLWRSREYGDTTVSALSLSSGKWSLFQAHGEQVTSDHFHCPRAGLSSREFYLNLIFAPGAFSTCDIRKVLNIYKGTPQFEYTSQKQDLRSKVCAALEMEIQAEALEYELSDEEYIDISERCWNKFYVNCLQYQETGKIANSLFWLSSSSLLVVISKNNVSFFRNVDMLEEALLQPHYSHESQSYKHVLNILSKIRLNEEQDLRFDRCLKGFDSIKEVTANIAAEFKLQNKLNLELDAVMKYQDLQLTLRSLSDVLFMPETFEHTGDYCDSFRSELGVQLIFRSVSQIVKMRLLVCRNFALLIQILDSSEIKRDFLLDTLNLCQAYAILNWCCETVVPSDKRLTSLMQLILSKPDIIFQAMILDSVWLTLQHLWPLTNSRYLAECLLFSKQHLLFTGFSRMINHKPWSDMVIQNFIETNEPYKAFDLAKEIIDSPENCLKVIKMFECADHSDIVIQLAELAVEKAIKIDHHDLATLHSILFLHHLKLGHYDLAFLNMEKNSKFSRRVDCLRELVITLMNSKNVEKLLNFPYNDLLPYLEDIIEQRARSLQPHQAAPYYNFLYALHVRLENYRKAARVMFEQGFRSDDNRQQVVSYSIAANCLSLVNSEHAWLLKPKTTKENSLQDEQEMLEIYQLSDLVKEFELASARFKLLNCPPDVSAYEVVMKLISAGRYKLALRISSLFNLKLEPALEALAAACTRITEDPDPWCWLVENDISDFIIGDENAAVVAWRLLEALLLKYEEPQQTALHKAVACKIMSLDVILPFWLEISYKKRNPSELLRLYLRYGELTEATKLCCALVAAVLGKGKENFGIQDAVAITSTAKCLPTSAVDILLLELECHQMNDLYEEVRNMVDMYLNAMRRITNDRERYSGNNETTIAS